MPEEEQDPLAEQNEEPELGEELFDDSVRPVASSMVEAWGYNRENEEIEVSFVNGHTNTYSCSPSEWEEAKETVSPGRFMHQNFL